MLCQLTVSKTKKNVTIDLPRETAAMANNKTNNFYVSY